MFVSVKTRRNLHENIMFFHLALISNLETFLEHCFWGFWRNEIKFVGLQGIGVVVRTFLRSRKLLLFPLNSLSSFWDPTSAHFFNSSLNYFDFRCTNCVVYWLPCMWKVLFSTLSLLRSLHSGYDCPALYILLLFLYTFQQKNALSRNFCWLVCGKIYMIHILHIFFGSSSYFVWLRVLFCSC